MLANWLIRDRSVSLVGLFLHPDLKLVGGATQHFSADRIEVPIGIEKADDSPVKASISPKKARCSIGTRYTRGLHFHRAPH
jgi:hypothetical protein